MWRPKHICIFGQQWGDPRSCKYSNNKFKIRNHEFEEWYGKRDTEATVGRGRSENDESKVYSWAKFTGKNEWTKKKLNSSEEKKKGKIGENFVAICTWEPATDVCKEILNSLLSSERVYMAGCKRTL